MPKAKNRIDKLTDFELKVRDLVFYYNIDKSGNTRIAEKFYKKEDIKSLFIQSQVFDLNDLAGELNRIYNFYYPERKSKSGISFERSSQAYKVMGSECFNNLDILKGSLKNFGKVDRTED